MSDYNEAMDSVFEDVEDNPHLQRQRSNSVPLHAFDTRVDKVYTVGCFDLFHRGHITLLQRMKALGKQVSSNHIGCITFPPYIVLPPRLYKSWTLHENNYLPLKTYKLQTNVRRLFSVLTMNIPGEDCSETCLAHLFIDLHFYYSIESHNGRYRILILINIYLGKECLSGMFCDFDTDPCICVLHTTCWKQFVSVSLLQKKIWQLTVWQKYC